jgi:hypothetical protein
MRRVHTNVQLSCDSARSRVKVRRHVHSWPESSVLLHGVRPQVDTLLKSSCIQFPCRSGARACPAHKLSAWAVAVCMSPFWRCKQGGMLQLTLECIITFTALARALYLST